MSTVHLVPDDILDRYHVKEWRNATGILATSCSDEWQDVQDVLRGFSLLRSEILVGGRQPFPYQPANRRRILCTRLGGERFCNLDNR